MARSKYRLDKITALVYGGAAALIFLVGIRTILRTADVDVDWLTPVTLIALVIEFCVLVLYAFGIYGEAKRLEREDPETTPKPKTKSDPQPGLPNHVLEKIEELVALNTANEQAIRAASDSLSSIKDSIESMNERNIQRLVQEELSRLAQSSIRKNS